MHKGLPDFLLPRFPQRHFSPNRAGHTTNLLLSRESPFVVSVNRRVALFPHQCHLLSPVLVDRAHGVLGALLLAQVQVRLMSDLDLVEVGLIPGETGRPRGRVFRLVVFRNHREASVLCVTQSRIVYLICSLLHVKQSAQSSSYITNHGDLIRG